MVSWGCWRVGGHRRPLARLIRQLMTESVLLAIASGFVGFLMSVWLMSLASQLKLPYPVPVRFDLTPDARVLWFCLALSLVTAIAFGLAPALQATRADITPALKDGGNVQLRKFGRFSLRNLLVLYQVAGSLMLLLLTGFLVRSFEKTTAIDVGFNPRNLDLISLDPVRDGYSGEQAVVFFEKLLDRVQRLPSVTAANFTES